MALKSLGSSIVISLCITFSVIPYSPSPTIILVIPLSVMYNFALRLRHAWQNFSIYSASQKCIFPSNSKYIGRVLYFNFSSFAFFLTASRNLSILLGSKEHSLIFCGMMLYHFGNITLFISPSSPMILPSFSGS